MQPSFSTFFEFGFLDFSLDSIKFLKCMIWQTNFFCCFFCFFLVPTTFLLWVTTHAIDGLPDWKQNFSHENCFEKGLSFGRGLFMPFLSKERVTVQKCSQEMGNFLFGQRAPRHQSKMILKYYGLRTCVFCYRKGVDRFEVVASFDAYQITKYQVLQKLIFCCLISEEFEKKNFKSRIFLLVA